MRVGDIERDATLEELRTHAAAGRLDLAELEERMDSVLAARTDEELAAVTADLPAPPTPPYSGFREHLSVYLAVQTLLLAIWALTGMGYFWPVWPAMGWGIGIAVHGACDLGNKRSWARELKKAPRRKAIASS